MGSPASLRREVEASLRRLGVDRIDLYQLHWPAEDGTPLEEYWQTFADLRTEGKIRAAGLSNHNVAQLTAAEAVGHVDSLQPQFSLIHRDAGAELIPWCAAHDTGVIVYSPMGAGLLTGVGQIILKHLSSGNGIDTTAAIWFHAGRMPPWRTLGSAVLSVIIVGMGASLGREGAPKQAGAVAANFFSDLGKLSDEQRRLLVACGAAASGEFSEWSAAGAQRVSSHPEPGRRAGRG